MIFVQDSLNNAKHEMVSQAIQATTGGLQMLGRLEAVCAAHGLETRAAALREVASDVSPDHPVVISKFVEGAKEIEVDAVIHD